MSKQILLATLLLPTLGFAAQQSSKPTIVHAAQSELEGSLRHLQTITTEAERLTYLNELLANNKPAHRTKTELGLFAQAIRSLYQVKRYQWLEKIKLSPEWRTCLLEHSPSLTEVFAVIDSAQGALACVEQSKQSDEFVRLTNLVERFLPECWNGTCPRRTVEDAAEKLAIKSAQYKHLRQQLIANQSVFTDQTAEALAFCILARKLEMLGEATFNEFYMGAVSSHELDGSVFPSKNRHVQREHHRFSQFCPRFSEVLRGPNAFRLLQQCNDFSPIRTQAIVAAAEPFMPQVLAKLVAAYGVTIGRSIQELSEAGAQFNTDMHQSLRHDCINSLSGLAENMGSGVQYLDLGRNYLTELDRADGMALRNIRTLCLATNDISEIEAGTFKDCNTLYELVLSDNALRAIPADTLPLGLTELYVAENELGAIPAGTLPTNLVHLDLSNNLLTEVPQDIYRMPKLAHLNLDENCLDDSEVSKLCNWWLNRTDRGDEQGATSYSIQHQRPEMALARICNSLVGYSPDLKKLAPIIFAYAGHNLFVALLNASEQAENQQMQQQARHLLSRAVEAYDTTKNELRS